MTPEQLVGIAAVYLLIYVMIYLYQIFGTYGSDDYTVLKSFFWPFTLIISPFCEFVSMKWDAALFIDSINEEHIYHSFYKKKLINEWVITTTKDYNTRYDYFSTKEKAELHWVTLKV